MKSIKERIGTNWCIKITHANRKKVRECFKPDIQGHNWSIGAFYGVTYDGLITGNRTMKNVSTNLLTDKEFFKRANIQEYEIF